MSQIFSTVTSACLIAAWIFGTSPPGSITTAFWVAVHQIKVQFCSNGVTGMIIAPAFALVFGLLCHGQDKADFLYSAKEKFREVAAFAAGHGVMTERSAPELRADFRHVKHIAPFLIRVLCSGRMESSAQKAVPVPAPDRRQSETALAIARGTARLLRALGFACISELPLPSGRRADLVAINERGEIWIVEIKSSIEDLRADQKWPDYRAHCDRLFFAFTQDCRARFSPPRPD